MNGLFSNSYSITLNFFGKTAGSIINNRNIAKLNNVELDQLGYDNLAKLDTLIVTGDIECYFDLSVVLSRIYSNDISNLRNALKSIEIVDGLVWNNNTSVYETYNLSNLSNYVNIAGIIKVKYTNPDFPQIVCNFSKLPDVLNPNKLPVQKLEQNFNIFIRNLCFTYGNENMQDKYIFTYYKDAENYYALHKTTDNRIEFIKVVNGIENIIRSDILSFQAFQTFNIYVSINKTRTRLAILQNNGNLYDYNIADSSYIFGSSKFISLSWISQGYECDGFYGLIKSNNKDYSDTEVLDLLYGKSKIVPNPNLFNKDEMLINKDEAIFETSVLPNNMFKLDIDSDGGTITLKQYYNNIDLGMDILVSGTGVEIIQTHSLCNKIKFTISNYSKFTKIEFKYYTSEKKVTTIDGGLFTDSYGNETYDGGNFIDSISGYVYDGDIWSDTEYLVANGGLFTDLLSSAVYDGGSFTDNNSTKIIDGGIY